MENSLSSGGQAGRVLGRKTFLTRSGVVSVHVFVCGRGAEGRSEGRRGEVVLNSGVVEKVTGCREEEHVFVVVVVVGIGCTARGVEGEE